VTSGRGVPLCTEVTIGQAHESQTLEPLMDTVNIRRRRLDSVAGDRAYRMLWIRQWLSRLGIEAVIPMQRNQTRVCLVRRKYQRRNVVERCVGWLKETRRVVTRYEKLATHYLAIIKLAMIKHCLRILDLSNRA
jgi:transposase